MKCALMAVSHACLLCRFAVPVLCSVGESAARILMVFPHSRRTLAAMQSQLFNIRRNEHSYLLL